MGTISIPYGREFQAHATTGICMPHQGLDPDLSFLHQKIKLGLCAHDHWLSRLNEQTARAQIPNSRNVARLPRL